MNGTATTISYGSNSNDKYPTYYFRKALTLDAAPSSTDQMLLNYQVDDGLVVYVNGQEAARYNMPSGTINYNTFSSTYAESTPLTGTLQLSPALFRKGDNVIAVEVHNTSATSSDIFWAAELLTTMGAEENNDLLSTATTLTLPTTGSQTITACFEPLSDEERQAAGMPPVRINEVSAANDMAVNEYWKRNDWVELYNTTDDDIDLEGMYLTDNIDKPEKYMISRDGGTAQTIIPAHGFLTVWCDKLATQTYLHAPFKLAADGGDVMLTAADGSWSDRLTYTRHDGDQSVGRYPDGSHQVYLMTMPTIGRANLMTSYAEALDEAALQDIRAAATSEARRLLVRYALGDLIVRGSSTDERVDVTIYSPSGLQVSQQTVQLVGGCATIPVHHLPQGCYIAKLRTNRGSTTACKFLIN